MGGVSECDGDSVVRGFGVLKMRKRLRKLIVKITLKENFFWKFCFSYKKNAYLCAVI